MLLRRVIGDALRARRQFQHRTLREISTAANVSLGYLSEIERGQKEASSELLAAICEALGSELADVLRDATDSLARAEQGAPVLAEPVLPEPVLAEPLTEPVLTEPVLPESGRSEEPALPAAAADPPGHLVSDGSVSVCVSRKGPLRTTLHAVRNRRPGVARAAN